MDRPPLQGQEGTDLSEHMAAVRGCLASAHMRVRQLAARALLSLLSHATCVPTLFELLCSLPTSAPLPNNNLVRSSSIWIKAVHGSPGSRGSVHQRRAELVS